MAPAFFTKDLPSTPLDGELWCGRGLFSQTISIVKKQKGKAEQDWKYVTYLVFDAPTLLKPYEERVKWLISHIKVGKQTTYASVVGVCQCKHRAHLQTTLKQVLLKGGEGLMLRKKRSEYEHRRSYNLLKCKFFHDEEAKVVGSAKGSGRCADMMGKLFCVLPNGVQFKIGTGFSDAQRRKPPPVGSVITFKYQELSNHGNPRFPVFLRLREDMTWADVLANAKTKIPYSQVQHKQKALQVSKQHSILFSTIPSRDEHGRKVITQDDVEEDDDEAVSSGADVLRADVENDDEAQPDDEDATATSKPLCKYGSLCYRRINDDHNRDYRHFKSLTKPTKQPSPPPSAASPPPPLQQCPFGSKCYRTNPTHLSQYVHTTRDEEEEGGDEVLPLGNVSVSRVDLADYFHLKGDDDEEVIQMELEEIEEELDGSAADNGKAVKEAGQWTVAGAGGSGSGSGSGGSSGRAKGAANGASSGSGSGRDKPAASAGGGGAGASVVMTKAEYERLKREAAEETVVISRAEYEQLKSLAERNKRSRSESDASTVRVDSGTGEIAHSPAKRRIL